MKNDGAILPLKVLVPLPAHGPVEVVIEHTALRLAVADRPLVRSLGDGWEVPGAYVLLDRPDAEGHWGAYVGKASPGKLRSRVLEHLRGKQHWYRAVLIRRDTEYGFHSAQAGWLEGRLYDLLHDSARIRLHNGNRPSDETLPHHEQVILETCIEPIVSLLHVLGHEVAAVPQKKKVVLPSKPTLGGKVRIVDLITEGLIIAGGRIVSKSPIYPGYAEIDANGAIWLQGAEATSLSDAAGKLCQAGSWNGWEFWHVETDDGLVPLSTLRDEVRKRRANGHG
ncbi:hypothetical protein [Microtetraspora sp. NBRC 16547]|uniref:restriction system modified-DNA reader domain-containing protein n=1 Tax=Microtetraspora sp. NBRC 16547 TaxID=3030993 RepID=UPI00255534FF|nr:hypothetical protein [Microtetraspora sp. NBRC 16547]